MQLDELGATDWQLLSVRVNGVGYTVDADDVHDKKAVEVGVHVVTVVGYADGVATSDQVVQLTLGA